MIEELLQQEEGKTLEFKENTKGLDGIIHTIVAFANTAGGKILIGAKDKTKETIGVQSLYFVENYGMQSQYFVQNYGLQSLYFAQNHGLQSIPKLAS